MRLRLLNALLYGGLSFMAAWAIGPPLRLSLNALLGRYSYVPDLVAPWLWIGLGAVLLLALADASRRLVMGRTAGVPRYMALLLTFAACLAARKGFDTPVRPTLEDGLSHLMARTELAADTAFAHDKKYPDRADVLTEQWPPELRDLGFYERGAVPLRSRMHVVITQVYGPTLIPDTDVRPGDLIFARSEDGHRYWLTAFVTSHGHLEPMVDAAGHIIVAAAIEGHPTSRMDPLFPEYPNKVPHHGPL